MRRRTLMSSESADEHKYVEIGGVKWATTNIGAQTETDYGLYFQWGDTAGYTSSQVGSSSTSFKKPFKATDCVLHNGTTAITDSNWTKYNDNDNSIVLEPINDAAVANWGGNWRMPLSNEFFTLSQYSNHQWVTSYNGVSVNGMLFTDKTDSNKKLFFPAAGYLQSGSFDGAGTYGFYWSKTRETVSNGNAMYMFFGSSDVSPQSSNRRFNGFNVRPILES